MPEVSISRFTWHTFTFQFDAEHKATTLGNLKAHIRSVHEKVKSPSNQCDYKAEKFDKTHLCSAHESETIHI